MKISEGLKTIAFAIVGVGAITGEKAGQIIDELVKKGELTVEEGKILDSELAKKLGERAESISEGVKSITPEKIGQSVKDLIKSVGDMTKEQREALRKALDRADAEEVGEEAAAGEEAAEEAPAEEAPAEEAPAEEEPAAEEPAE